MTKGVATSVDKQICSLAASQALILMDLKRRSNEQREVFPREPQLAEVVSAGELIADFKVEFEALVAVHVVADHRLVNLLLIEEPQTTKALKLKISLFLLLSKGVYEAATFLFDKKNLRIVLAAFYADREIWSDELEVDRKVSGYEGQHLLIAI